MRIIAGRFRGRALASPEGHLTRPSTARTRESLFSLIDARIYLDGAEVLDLFAGTGALGLEAISRGAAFVTFVEQDAQVLDAARANADTLGVTSQCLFVQSDAVAFLKRYTGPPLDLILADPPYDLPALRDLPDLALDHLTDDGVFTLEHSTHDWFDDHPHRMLTRAYGRTVVSLFRPPLPPADEEDAPDALDANAPDADAPDADAPDDAAPGASPDA
jgi:16S rRNA (guanine(966)-N(2))-methyltransferase RsmD